MTGEILKLDDFVLRYGVHNDYSGGIVCVRVDSSMLNRCELSDAYCDIYTVMLPTQGSFRVAVNYVEYLVKPGNCLLLAPHTIVSHIAHSNNFAALQMIVERGVFEQLICRDGRRKRMDTLNEAWPLIPLTLAQQENMRQLLAYAVSAMSQSQIYKDVIIPDLVHIVQFYVLEYIQGSNFRLHEFSHTDEIFRRFVHLAVDHFRSEHKIAFYAERLNISEAYLSRIVRHASGQTVKGYLSALLFAEAGKLLRATDRSVSEIARDLHFTDLSAFGKFFKTQADMSPQHYRQIHEMKKNGIIHARASDLQAITAIENSCFPVAEAASENVLRERLRHYPDHFWLFWENNQLLGFIDGLLSNRPDLTDRMYASPGEHTPDGRWLMILGVCTLPERRHEGVATRLMQQVVKDMRQQGRHGIVLTCKQQLIPFYELFGFRKEGVSRSTHGNVTWYQMRLEL